MCGVFKHTPLISASPRHRRGRIDRRHFRFFIFFFVFSSVWEFLSVRYKLTRSACRMCTYLLKCEPAREYLLPSSAGMFVFRWQRVSTFADDLEVQSIPAVNICAPARRRFKAVPCDGKSNKQRWRHRLEAAAILVHRNNHAWSHSFCCFTHRYTHLEEGKNTLMWAHARQTRGAQITFCYSLSDCFQKMFSN